MKLHTKIFAIMASLFVGAAVLSSCTKEEEAFSTDGKTPLETPTVVAGEVSTSSISFSWNAVDKASQYYYKVVNPSGYTVAKGTTTETSVTVKGLKFSTDFTVYVDAVPSASYVEDYCSSKQAQIVITTDSPIIINYDWVQDGTAWFYSDDNTWNKCAVTVGRETGTGHFIITSWMGVEGFDLYFDIDEWDGTFPVTFHYSTNLKFHPTVGQAIDQAGPLGDRGDLELGHGMGGKAYDYIYWYGKGASYDYGTLDPTGGYIDLWCKDYDGTWCGWRVEYGEYAPEPEPDPVPDADAEESWSSEAAWSIDDVEQESTVNVSFDASSKAYTLEAWYGVEGYDVVFTRDEKTGDWVIDPSCSAYAGEDENGKVGLYHGLGRALNSICWVDNTAWSSGMTGTEESGYLNAAITLPNGEDGAYKVKWPNIVYAWTMDALYDSRRYAEDDYMDATISYNEVADNYTITMPQYGDSKLVFTTDADGSFIPDGCAKGDTWYCVEFDDDWVYIKLPNCHVDLKAGIISIDSWHNSDEWTDTFSWKGMPGVDALVGTYAQETGIYYRDPVNGWTWLDNREDPTAEFGDVTVTKVDATTIMISGLADVEDGILGVVDEDNMVITIAEGQAYDGCYLNKTITATYDMNCTITFNDTWSATKESDGKVYWDQGDFTLIHK